MSLLPPLPVVRLCPVLVCPAYEAWHRATLAVYIAAASRAPMGSSNTRLQSTNQTQGYNRNQQQRQTSLLYWLINAATPTYDLAVNKCAGGLLFFVSVRCFAVLFGGCSVLSCLQAPKIQRISTYVK
jgi:hypothetical protein